MLGETYVRLGRNDDAVRIWTEDHKDDPDDAYVTGALADLYLDLGRPADAAKLVADKEDNDALLLRLALAESQLHGEAAKDAERHAKMVHDRFTASHLRGDVVHRREEAREVLGLDHDGKAALTLALANFGVQREPWGRAHRARLGEGGEGSGGGQAGPRVHRAQPSARPAHRCGRARAGSDAVMRRLLAVVLCTLVLLLLPRAAWAHKPSDAYLTLTVQPAKAGSVDHRWPMGPGAA